MHAARPMARVSQFEALRGLLGLGGICRESTRKEMKKQADMGGETDVGRAGCKKTASLSQVGSREVHVEILSQSLL
jgi:hypothetical protein